MNGSHDYSARDYASQMDFDYDNRTGPVSQDAPFLKSMRHNGSANPPQQSAAGQMDGMKKRPFGAFSSPQKSSSGFGNLRNPSGESLFSRPAEAGADAAFTTPRVSRETEIPSSGPETSPGDHADSEATPDNSNALIKFTSKNSKAPNPFTFISGSRSVPDGQHSPLAKQAHASGRGEIRNRKIAKRPRKDSDRERQQKLQHKASVTFGEDIDSEYDDGHPAKRPRTPRDRPHQQPRPGILASILDFIDRRPDLPATLSRYAQLALNIVLIGVFLSLIFGFLSTIRADVDKKSAEVRAGILHGIAACAKEYQDNGCFNTGAVPPKLQQHCADWKACMERDENLLGRAKVSMTLFAEIFNEFVEPISWKAFSFCVILAAVCFIGGNTVFMLFRGRLGGQAPHVHQQQQQWAPPAPFPPTPYGGQPQWYPQTPGRGMGYGPAPQMGYYDTPSRHRQASPMRPGIEPGPSWYPNERPETPW